MSSLGRIFADVAGLELSAEEREFLRHPDIGGVILFARNFSNREQLVRLTSEIRAVRTPQLLIAVDHEGGRVQRFRDGFTRIPPMKWIGDEWTRNRAAALGIANAAGVVIGHELREVGVDFSFTPVLDVDYGQSGVIGDRAFSRNAECISELATALCLGLRTGGVSAVGKHFPGHGYVAADSHVDVPVDTRSYGDMVDDLLPFRRLIDSGLEAIMPAHVIYQQVDGLPAGFSAHWLGNILRKEMAFTGMIFSDDLMMEGAKPLGSIAQRATKAFEAGCDMVLVCNAPAEARRLAEEMAGRTSHLDDRLAELMRAKQSKITGEDYRRAVALIDTFSSDRT